MKHQFRLTFIICSALISGCITLPASTPPENKIISWQAREKQLRSISNWELKGAIGVKQEEKGFTAQVNWQQSKSSYQVHLFGPLGSGQVQLNGTDQQITLIDANKKKSLAANPELLLKQETGWELPISNLKYWIRGLSAPNSAAKRQFDTFQHLKSLEQLGWQIEFLRYTQVKGIDLPSKITLNRNQLRIRIIIKEWRI